MRRLMTVWLLGLLACSAALSALLWTFGPGPVADGKPAWLLEIRDEAATDGSEDPSEDPEARAAAIDRIAVIRRDGSLVTIDPRGGEPRELQGDDEIRFGLPTWSPDARRLATIGIRGNRASVYLTRDEPDAQSRQLYTDAVETPFYLYWAPGGRFLGFLANHAEEGVGLHAAEPGTGEHNLLAAGTPLYWSWAQRNPQVLVHAAEAGSGEGALGLVDIVTGARQSLGATAVGSFRTPGISPSGRYLSYGQPAEGEVSQIVVLDRQDPDAEPQTIDHLGLAPMSWSPAADELAFLSPRQDADAAAGPLRLIDAESGRVRGLVGDSVLAFFWSPDGRWIAYLTLERTLDQDSIRAAAPGRLQVGWTAGTPDLTRPTRPARIVAQSTPDLEMVLRVVEVARSARGPRELARFHPSRSFTLQVLPFFDQYALSHRIWSPDSTSLVLPMRQPGGSMVRVIPIDGSPPRDLIRGSLAFWSPR